MLKYAIITIILVVVGVVICAVVLPGRHDEYYCALCNTIKEEKYCLGKILIYSSDRQYGKISSWRECDGKHIWIFGSSRPYHGGNFDHYDGQYGFWHAHELIDKMDKQRQQEYKTEVIELAKSWDGSNAGHQKLREMIERMKIGLTNR